MPDISEFTSAIGAFGTLLYRGDGLSPEGFVLIAEVTNFTQNRSWTKEDVTAHGANDAVRRTLPTILDMTLSLELNFLPVGHEDLEAAFYAKSIDNYRFRVPSEVPVGSPGVDYKEFEVPMRITSFPTQHPATGKLGATIEMEMLQIPVVVA